MDSSRFSRLDPRVFAVLLVVLIVGVVAMKIRDKPGGIDEQSDGTNGATASRNHTVAGGNRIKSRIQRGVHSTLRNQDPIAITRLRNYRDAGDFASIHAELESLSGENRLADVSDLLKEWCRKGEMELVQWCLATAAENEDSMELELAAEALSNPSDIMREVAASRLEEVSGLRFVHSSEARAWLSALPPESSKVPPVAR